MNGLKHAYIEWIAAHKHWLVESDLRDEAYLLQWAAGQPIRWLKERYADGTLELDEFERLLDLKFGLTNEAVV